MERVALSAFICVHLRSSAVPIKEQFADAIATLLSQSNPYAGNLSQSNYLNKRSLSFMRSLRGNDWMRSIVRSSRIPSYPAVHSKLYKGQLDIHAWVYKIESGGVFVYSTQRCHIKADHEEDDLDQMEEQQPAPLPLNGKKTPVLAD